MITPSFPAGRETGGTGDVAGADEVAFECDELGSCLIVLAIEWSSCADHAECAALHHPKPRSCPQGRKPRIIVARVTRTVPLQTEWKSIRKTRMQKIYSHDMRTRAPRWGKPATGQARKAGLAFAMADAR